MQALRRITNPTQHWICGCEVSFFAEQLSLPNEIREVGAYDADWLLG
jgi:hypothetical protein